MFLDVVVFFGLLFAWQLHGISRKLNRAELQSQSLTDLAEELQGVRRDIADCVRELRECIREAPTTIVDELSWHKNLSFAHELREWIETAATRISEEVSGRLDSIAASISEEVGGRLDSLGQTLKSIDDNTSRN